MRPSFFGIIAGGSSFDPDAQAFITAAGITDPTQQGAIDDLVVGLKADSLWAKLSAIYPFVGGTATTHKYNLKDPQDTDAAYRMTWVGGITHDANGVTGNGTTGYGNTNLNPTSASITNIACSVYVAANAMNGVGDFGAIDAGAARIEIVTNYNGDAFWAAQSSEKSQAAGAAGLHQSVRVDGTDIFYQSNLVRTTNTGAASVANLPVYLMSVNAGGLGFSARNFRFCSIGAGFTTTDADNLYTNVQAFETTLGRQV